MTTDGIEQIYIETRNYGATAAFWRGLGFENTFETDHGSGTWEHPKGGPSIFINEQHERDLDLHLVLSVAEARGFAAQHRELSKAVFTPQLWGAMLATVHDPDGRPVGLTAPVPDGVTAPDMDEHHREKYGSASGDGGGALVGPSTPPPPLLG